ncbi:MAG: transporter substrate-binding domain-containing protein [Magnetovibrio sp.]|nr:transporter substrate-binding domain-containing protein [Magnetovibrio sp.]
MFHQIASQAIQEAYKRIGYSVEFTWLPTRRSLITANAGECDGEMMRISGVNRTFSDLIQVKVPINQLQGVAFMKHAQEQDTPTITSWKDLHSLGTYTILGELYAERGTRDMVVGQVRTYKQLFTMLEKGHIDVGIGIREVGIVELSKNFADTNIHPHGEVLANSPMYHYVHKSRRHLIEQLETALNEMTSSGVLQSLNAAALRRLIRQP